MSPDRRRRHFVPVLLALLTLPAAAPGQDLALTPDAEAGFRRVLEMAQHGQLGDDVSNANVGISRDHVRLELLRSGAPPAALLLAPRRSAASASRFFEVTAGEGADAGDVARVARALDDAFDHDPFQIRVSEAAPDVPVPSLGEVVTAGNWRRVLRMFERRMTSLASAEYTTGVMVALGLGFGVSLGVLWFAAPPPRGGRERGAPRR